MLRLPAKKKGMLLSINLVLALMLFVLLAGGAAYGAHSLYLSHKIEAVQLQASAIDHALQEYAHGHQAVDYAPASQYGRQPRTDGHLYTKDGLLNYGMTSEYPMAIYEDGKVANQRGNDNSVGDDGLDFGYFHKQIEWCKKGEKPGPNVLYKFLYVPLDRYGNPIKTGNSQSAGFPVARYALVCAVRAQNGDTLYYLSKGSYPHESLTKTRPSCLNP